MMGQGRHLLDCSSSPLILYPISQVHSPTAVGYNQRIKTGLLLEIVIVLTCGYLTEGLFLSHKRLAEKLHRDNKPGVWFELQHYTFTDAVDSSIRIFSLQLQDKSGSARNYVTWCHLLS